MTRTVPFGGELVKAQSDASIDADLLPQGRILPDVSSLTESDNGDLLLFEHGAGWQRGGMANGVQIAITYDPATNSLKPDWSPSKKQRDVFDTFTEGGWLRDVSVETGIAGTNARGEANYSATKHTASQLTALTYGAETSNPSNFPTGNQYMAVRVPLYDRADADAGNIRIEIGDATEVLFTLDADDWVTSDASYAYYSKLFGRLEAGEGIGLGGSTNIQGFRLHPFGFVDGRIDPLTEQERAVIDGFSSADWADTTDAGVSGPSTLPYQEHSNNIRTAAYAATQAVSSQALAWNVGFRIPVAAKDRLARYRIEAVIGTITTYHAATAGDHVVDDATWAYYNLRFTTTGSAVALQVQALEQHHIDPEVVGIDLEDLRNTPATFAGANGKFLQANATNETATWADVVGDARPLVASGSGAVGDSKLASPQNHQHPAQTIATSTVDADVRPGIADATVSITPGAVNSWSTGGSYNIPTGKLGYLEFRPTTGRPVTAVVATDLLRRLTASTVGTAVTVPQSFGIAFGSHFLWLGRNSANLLHWACSDLSVTGTLYFYEQETSGILDETAIPDAMFPTMAADVSLPVPNAIATYGAWTDVFTVIDNTSDTKRAYNVGMVLLPEASWMAGTSGGERAGADFQVLIRNASDTLVSTLITKAVPYVRNGADAWRDVARYGIFDPSFEVDLEAGEKLVVRARGNSQTAGAGRSITLDKDIQFFNYREHAVLVSASSQQQIQSISNPVQTRFLFQRRTDTAVPTNTVGYDGVLYTGLGNWQLDVPPSGAGVLWMTSVFRYWEPLANQWVVRRGAVLPQSNVVYSHNPNGVPLQLTYNDGTQRANTRSRYISHLEPSGHFGPFLPLVGLTDLHPLASMHEFVSGRLNAFTSAFNYTGINTPDYDFIMSVGISGPDASQLLYTKQFIFRTEGMPQPAAAGSTTRNINDTWRVSMKNSIDTGQSISELSASDTAPWNRGAGVRQEFGFNFKLRRSATDGPTEASELYVFNPESWASHVLGNRTILSIDLWMRRNDSPGRI